jgi:hypothetical protein
MSYTGFTILISNDLIKAYYKCFGHFIIDHLYLLYKFKIYFEEQNINISTLNIIGDKTNLKNFMIEFYKILFDNIVYNENSPDYINLGVVLGSIQNTETKKIYLAQSIKQSSLIPDVLYENSRYLSKKNSKSMQNFRKCIWNYFNIKREEEIDVTIINRSENGREWINLQNLIDLLVEKKQNYKIINMENLKIKEQISLIYNSKYIILPSGSSQSHLFWADPDYTTLIECFIPGHRYINTLLYAKNLNIKFITLFSKFLINKPMYINNEIKKLILYNNNNKLLLDSTNITSNEITNEINWFELYLQRNSSSYYIRQCNENIDLQLYLSAITKIIFE